MQTTDNDADNATATQAMGDDTDNNDAAADIDATTKMTR